MTVRDISGEVRHARSKQEDGGSYENTYCLYLDILRAVAESPSPVAISHAPATWVPLLWFMGADVEHCTADNVFKEDGIFANRQIVQQLDKAVEANVARGFVESHCTARPELVDALWKTTCEWNATRCRDLRGEVWNVTTHAAFYRPEVFEWMARLYEYRVPSDVRACVLSNCAADKPYPAPIHTDIAERFFPDKRWHVVICTGVLGVIPQELWGEAPVYDSGVPNFHRLRIALSRYLARAHYDVVVVYTDLNVRAIGSALATAHATQGTSVLSPLPTTARASYADLRDPSHLEALAHAIRQGQEILDDPALVRPRRARVLI